MLTEQEIRFCHEYAKTMNAMQAALAVGYAEGHAGHAASWLVPRNKHYKPDVADYAQHLCRRRRERLDIEADKIIQEIAAIAFCNFASVANVHDNVLTIRDFCDIAENDKVAIAEVAQHETKDGGSIKIKLHDKLQALTLLSRHLGILKDTVVLDTGGEAMKAIMAAIDGATKGLPSHDKQPF